LDEEKKFTVLKMKEELEESNVALPPIDKLNAEVFEKVKVSERCERALMMTKTRILAINPAKWLQTGYLHPLLNKNYSTQFVFAPSSLGAARTQGEARKGEEGRGRGGLEGLGEQESAGDEGSKKTKEKGTLGNFRRSEERVQKVAGEQEEKIRGRYG